MIGEARDPEAKARACNDGVGNDRRLLTGRRGSMSRSIIPGIDGFPMGVATKLRGTDLVLVEEAVSKLVEPRRIRTRTSRPRTDIRISHVSIGLGHLFGVQHGEAVHATSGPIGSYQIMVPLRGRLVRHAQDADIVAEPGSALVYAPQDCLDTYWSERCVALVLSVPAEKLKALARSACPGLETHCLRVNPLMKLTEGSGRSFANALGTICQESVDPESAFSRGLTTRSLEETLLLSLLLAQKQDAPAQATVVCPNRQAYVVRALDYIDAHCADEIGMVDIVQATGVSVRTLQYGFMEQFGVGPMTHLRNLRLERIHAVLKAAPPGSCSVGDVAASWGFYNGSAFARAYRKQFGELPSETLARRKI
jgi:AraC-like DNA-binding protein